MEDNGIESVDPHSGYCAFALWTSASSAACYYIAWVHQLLYETDLLKYGWAYWVSMVLYLLCMAGVLLLMLGTVVQIITVWTLRCIRKHGIESLDKHTIISNHQQSKNNNQ